MSMGFSPAGRVQGEGVLDLGMFVHLSTLGCRFHFMRLLKRDRAPETETDRVKGRENL